jgi:hypothetical protein
MTQIDKFINRLVFIQEALDKLLPGMPFILRAEFKKGLVENFCPSQTLYEHPSSKLYSDSLA